jgi:hypothetical protein
MRIAPTPQQGGTQTIQQTINLSHDNPCGYNFFLDLIMGDTGLTYRQFYKFLYDAMNSFQARIAFSAYKMALETYNEDTTDENQKILVYNLYQYALAVASYMGMIPVQGYNYVFTVYNADGSTILDTSIASAWPPVLKTGDIYTYTTLVLQTYRNPTDSVCTVNNLLNQINIWSWIDQSVGNQAELINSSYLVNQVATPESTLAISSLLTDNANTRNYGLIGYGFSSRSFSPQNPSISHNVCYLNQVSTDTLLDSFFIRLSLVRI